MPTKYAMPFVFLVIGVVGTLIKKNKFNFYFKFVGISIISCNNKTKKKNSRMERGME